jgi:tetratricopeptide (TPR) repeat protein
LYGAAKVTPNDQANASPTPAAPARGWTGFCERLASPARGWRLAASGAILFALVLAVYRPVLPGSFLLDDWRLIETDNPLVTGNLTPFNLWFQTDFTLSTLALWLQHLAWGHSPGWYHAVNLLLHGASAVLFWRLLAKLRVPGAWLAAALYAVHPVAVNSVARIAEIKNTLSLPFFLLGFLAYLHYETLALYPEHARVDEPPARGRATGWYVVALLAFVAALLAKTSTVMLPVALLACAAWRRGRIGRKDWLHAAPFFALSAAFGLMSIWFQRHQALFSAGVTLAPQSLPERLAVAGHVLGFYLGKDLLPLNLYLVYPHWTPDPGAFATYLPPVALCAVAVICWRYRRSWGRHLLFGLGCFVILLFPALGFFDSQFQATWQVSDHLQYLPLLAPVALVAAALGGWLPRNLFPAVAVALLLGVSVLGLERSSVFVSEEKLLRDSLAKNPDDAFCLNDLGVILARRHELAAAQDEFEAAYRVAPTDPRTLTNLGQMLALSGQLAEAEADYRAALAIKPTDDNAQKRFAELLTHEGRTAEAIIHYRAGLAYKPDLPTRLSLAGLYHQTGDGHDAIAQFRAVLRTDPDNLEALNNLAWLLATFGDGQERNGAEAVRCAERACTLTNFKQAKLTGTLAAAYAEAGRFPDAVAIGRTTVKLADDAGDARTAAIGRQLLGLYLNNQPFHEPLVPSAGHP